MPIIHAFVLFTTLLVCSSGQLLAQSNTDSAQPPLPNIVFIMADDLGYGELGCFGQDKIKTPHIDELASEGMKLTQHYSGSPVCASSRCVVLTGKHTGTTQIRNNREMGGWGPDEPEGQLPLALGTETISSSLQNMGYATGAFGKWGLGGPNSEGHPNNQGFDTFYGYLCQRVAHNYYPTHLWRNSTKELLDGNDPWFSAHQKVTEAAESYEQYQGETYAPDLVLEETISFIDAHPKEPFFLYFASIIPHVALQIPDKELDAYPKHWDDQPYLGDQGYLPHPRPRAAYAAMITRFDNEVGAIVKALKRNGIADNTLIVVTSDNGPSWVGGVDLDFFESQAGLHGRKAQLWEGGIRVPTVLWWPGNVPAGSENETPTAFWDWYPTFMAAAGTEHKKGDGTNLLPHLLQDKPMEERGLYWEFGKSQAFRIDDWKLIQFQTKDGIDAHLYNVKQDPSELNNVAEAHPDLVTWLQELSQKARTKSESFPSFMDSLQNEK